jgi:hypothetical protein
MTSMRTQQGMEKITRNGPSPEMTRALYSARLSRQEGNARIEWLRMPLASENGFVKQDML